MAEQALGMTVQAANIAGLGPVVNLDVGPLVPCTANVGLHLIVAEWNQLHVAWDGAEPRGAPVLEYSLSVSKDGEEVSNMQVAADDRSAWIENLNPKCSYNVELTARNSVGASAPAKAARVFETPAAAPDQVTPEVELVKAGYTTLTYRWTEPDGRGSAVTGYTATVLNKDGDVRCTGQSKTTEFTATGLQYNSTNTCLVAAFNETGTGEASQPVHFAVKEAHPPGPPQPNASPDAPAGCQSITWELPVLRGPSPDSFELLVWPVRDASDLFSDEMGVLWRDELKQLTKSDPGQYVFDTTPPAACATEFGIQPTASQQQDPNFLKLACNANTLQHELSQLVEKTEYCVAVQANSCLGNGESAGVTFVVPPSDPIPRAQIIQLVADLNQMSESTFDAAAASEYCDQLMRIGNISPKHLFALAKLGALSAVLWCASQALEHLEVLPNCAALMNSLCYDSNFGLEALRHDPVAVESLESMLGGGWGMAFNNTCMVCLRRYLEHIVAYPYKTHPTPYLTR